VRFNDGSCGYYSKSYLCQKIQVGKGSTTLVNLGLNAHTMGKLNQCQGDCDGDSNCATGLKCFQRSGRQAVPGCKAGGTGDVNTYDYCFKLPASSTTLVDFGFSAHNLGKLNKCQGDCDSDSHCAAGLKCIQRNGKTAVPGCKSGGSGDTKDTDYCSVIAVPPCGPGSASNCKVTKVSVKGYSAGDLYRVDNGRQVRRSTETDSCPSGYKIWSPRNKNDWTLVYNALGKNIKNYPNGPHLIVDVTRPKNGCGGCTSYAMKTGVSQQGEWTTRDSSNWWLRDAKYSEPNGDYHANCYLHVYDVNPNNVRFNDGSCGYYSKSYLCQKMQFPIVDRFNNGNDHEGWNCGKIQGCGNFGNICGGFKAKGKGGYLQKIYRVPAGTYTLNLDFIKIDSWDNERAYIDINGQRKWTSSPLMWNRGQAKCGQMNGWQEEKIPVKISNIKIGNGGITVKVHSNLNENTDNESFGIDNVVLNKV